MPQQRAGRPVERAPCPHPSRRGGAAPARTARSRPPRRRPPSARPFRDPPTGRAHHGGHRALDLTRTARGGFQRRGIPAWVRQQAERSSLPHRRNRAVLGRAAIGEERHVGDEAVATGKAVVRPPHPVTIVAGREEVDEHVAPTAAQGHPRVPHQTSRGNHRPASSWRSGTAWPACRLVAWPRCRRGGRTVPRSGRHRTSVGPGAGTSRNAPPVVGGPGSRSCGQRGPTTPLRAHPPRLGGSAHSGGTRPVSAVASGGTKEKEKEGGC